MSADDLLPVLVSRQAVEDMERLVGLGLFGLSVSDCAQRFIDAALQQKAVEGWLPMPVITVPELAKTRRKR